ncbi:hypothetical protein EG329_008942 [Mollisiaceae sp. DMI_Dod_QoI]|nr:hypothetical protein EG329_008942 [Helotiales sp. DMI_Dod_QoI]
MSFTENDALYLAADIFQVIEFSAKIVSKGRELCRSPDGTLEENDGTGTVASRLQGMTQKLVTSLRPRPDPPKKNRLHEAANLSNENEEVPKISKEDDKLLRTICGNCIALSQTLLNYLGKLEVPTNDDGRKWKSFRQALKGVWSKGGVDDMARRLAEARKDLNAFVLIQDRDGVMDISFRMKKSRWQLLESLTYKTLKHAHLQESQIQEDPDSLSQRRAAWIDDDTEKKKELG